MDHIPDQRLNFEHELFETMEISWRTVHLIWPSVTLLLILIFVINDYGGWGSFSWLIIHLGPMVVYLIGFVLMTWLIIRQAPRQEDSWKGLAGRLFANAFFAGMISGFLVAVFKLFWYYELWTVFNLITEPLITGFIGLIITGVLGWSYFMLHH